MMTPSLLFINDGLFLGPSKSKLIVMIEALKQSGLKIENQDHPSDYICININKHHNGTYEFSQLALID